MTAGGISLRKRLALDITKKLQDDVIRDHSLRQLFWECTLRCNLACRHCGSDCRVQAAQKDMPVEDFCRVLDSIARVYDPHKVMINVTGGEPLMRPDLERCGREIYRREFPWGMVSNGLALTERRYKSLLNSGLHAMTLSLDGLEEDHDWMRGRKGSFSRTSEAIAMVIRSGVLAFDVVTCVNRRNLPRLGALKEYLISLGLKDWRLFTIFPAGRAAANADLKLSGQELRTMMDFIRNTRREGRIHASYGCEGFLGPYEGEVRDGFFMCNAGVTVAGILADGSISACPSIRADYHQGNIYKDDFIEVWNGRYQPYRDRSWMKTDPCADCRYFKWCRGNGMHLRDGEGQLMACRLKEMENPDKVIKPWRLFDYPPAH
ncbi:MAG: TIGR04133 family radical SAM/SPASM protein [Bacteroidales bacterium]|nr:TIGR04133 family radical SAM/SPASM protein [Bacteroidales bacterium]